ncbi:matrix metalloproteinase-14-like isoform X1 [Branchiostoma floridae]|uniref:Matrix metalloproteinase-14-like isoform X1 n=1 Tax=Branchiostoma floridae TaxID=7739 RepID=A0A9J7KB60_BRAFL|nr:matrix metalloproteinase-14-like isoform X1 [Branchiostoma floridae]
MNTCTFLAVLVSAAFDCVLADMTMQGGMNYLMNFGYMDPPSMQTGQLQSEDAMREAISMFQEFANITVTGKLDNETMAMMAMPRCGVPDMMGTHSRGMARRRRRYALQGSTWPKRDLTWSLADADYTPDLGKGDVDEAITRAFQLWQDQTPLTFTRVSPPTQADIFIKFAPIEHGDGAPFDGPGGTLAHAFFPQFGGDAHFDESEQWTVKTASGTNLLQVAAHEFGHSLGLSHSEISDALMAPFYRGYEPDFVLHSDDIAGIQMLYGMPDMERPTPRPDAGMTPNPNPNPDVPDTCSGELDAITITEDGKTYAFRGNYFWELNSAGMVAGYPKLISDVWGDLPGDLDAAMYYRANKKLYFYKGDQYWRYTNTQLDTGYPRPMSQWGGVPSDIDSAYIWSGNGRLYFTKDDQYYRYRAGTGVDRGYPRDLSVWNGVPADGVDTVMQWLNGRTYFFKGSQYWRFNDTTFSVDPGYPKSTAQYWFGCMMEMEPTTPKPTTPKLPPCDLQGVNSGVNVVPTVVLPSLLSVLVAKLLLF